MPSVLVYTDSLKPGIAQMPIFSVGDDTNWSFQFNNGQSLWNPGNVTLVIGYINGVQNLTYSNAFQWVDRLNNSHVGSFAVTGGVPGSLTWDDAPVGVFGSNGVYLLQGRTPPSSQIRKVRVVAGGSALSSAPIVRFNGGSPSPTGKGAVITVGLSTGALNQPIIVSPGEGYSEPPEIIVTDPTGSGGFLVCTITNGQVSSVSVEKGGASYTAPVVLVLDPEASATATVGGSSTVTGLVLAQGGQSYTSAPTVGFSGGGGTSAAATANLLFSTWGLGSIAVTNPGSGFTSPPAVSFSGGSGSGAAAVAVISAAGFVGKITLTNGGSYSAPPTGLPGGWAINVGFSGGAGSGAAATAYYTFSNGVVTITSINVTNGGMGYTSNPTVTITVTMLTQVVAATATSVVTTGTVTSIILTNPGTGYGSTAPTVAFTGGGGTGAAATAVLAGSPVANLTLTAAGSGYTTPPVIAFSGGNGTGAAATATLSLGITAVTMVQGGFAYAGLPTVDLEPGPGGSSAGAVLEAMGIETNAVPFLRFFSPNAIGTGMFAVPWSRGRQNLVGSLMYDDSLLIIQPQVLLAPGLALAPDGLTWAGQFNPVTAFIQALLTYRRTAAVDFQVYGAGRLLLSSSLAIQNP